MSNLVLVGNPNVGKSIFFNAFTGIYAEVSNFPGTTVDVSRGKFKNYVVFDTPGIYGVSSFNDEERVARDVIVDADIVVNVVDALHLNRDLFLTQQLIDMGKRVFLCVNMLDELEKNNITLDSGRLSSLLGIPVIMTSAAGNINIDIVKERFGEARRGRKMPELENRLFSYSDLADNDAERLLLAEDDEYILDKYEQTANGNRDEIYIERRRYVDNIVNKVMKFNGEDKSVASKLGNFLLEPKTGIPALIIVLLIMFSALGYLVAQKLVDLTEGVLFKGYFEPFIINLTGNFTSASSLIGRFLIGEFGLFTMVPTYTIGLLLPLVAGFYLMLSVLEDSGYLPRIAALSDRVLSKIGLNGKAVIPFILGFGCVTVATIGTRVLGSRRERVIATALLGLTIPCSAQFGVIIGSISKIGSLYALVYVMIIVLIFAALGRIMDKVLKGVSTPLLIDLPRMRIPRAKNVLKKTFLKTKHFLFEAVPIFALGALLITFLDVSGALNKIVEFFSPVVVGFLKLPKEATPAFIMGIVRRDFGAAGLDSLALTNKQTLVSMVTLTLFVPCIASVMMIFKERSKKEAVIIWLGSFFIAFLVGGILMSILSLG